MDRRVGLAVIATVIALAGGGAARKFVVPTREAWSLIGADEDGAIVYARFSVSDTGFLDRQLTTRFLLLPAGVGIIEHRAMGAAATLGPEGVSAGTDALVSDAEGWELRIGGDGLAARARVRGFSGGEPEISAARGERGVPAEGGCAPVAGVMGGAVEDAVDGRLLSGPALIVRTRARGAIDNTALYVLGNGFTAAIDPLADCPAWARAGDQTWSGEPGAFDLEPGVLLKLGEWTLKLRAVGPAVDQDAWAHTLWAERALAALLLGQRAPHVVAHRVLIRVDGPGVATLAPALALRRR